jgi:hypothetical protein
MKLLNNVIAVVPAMFLLVSCATEGQARFWTHPSLSETQRQQEFDRCMGVATEAEKEYLAATTTGAMNSFGPYVQDLRQQTRAKTQRDETLASCLQSAGFSRR